MTALRVGNGGTHGSRPTGCGGHTGRTGSSAPTTGRRGRRPLRWGTRTVQNGTSGTPSPTHSVIARSEATRQSVLPSLKRRIPEPVTRSLARDDSVPRWERRDTWVPPYRVRRSSRADRGVRPYKAEQEPCEAGRRGRRPLHTLSLRGAKRRGNPFSPSPKRRIPTPVCTPRALASRRALARNDGAPRWERRDTWVPPYGVRRSSRADRGVRPYNGTAGTACPTNRRGAARTAKFRNFFFPLSASAGLRRLYSDDTGRPPVL